MDKNSQLLCFPRRLGDYSQGHFLASLFSWVARVPNVLNNTGRSLVWSAVHEKTARVSTRWRTTVLAQWSVRAIFAVLWTCQSVAT